MKKITLVAAAVLLVAVNALAQDPGGLDPGAIQRRTRDTLEYFRLQKEIREQQAPRQDEPLIDREKAGAREESEMALRVLFVRKIETDPSEILTEEELRAITGEYENSLVRIKDLFTVVERINAQYEAKKIITARAFLPPQEVEDGVVRIRLVEGRTGDVHIEGNRYIRSSYVRDRISLEEGRLIRMDELERDLIRFNRTNEARVRADIQAGERFGATDAVIRVQEPPRHQFTLFTDNMGRESVGLYRLGFLAVESSIFGLSDPLTLGGIFADGTASGSVSYSLPVSTLGTRLLGWWDFNKIDIRSGPLTSLGISGYSHTLGASITHPFEARRRFKLDGTFGLQKNESKTEAGDFLLTKTKVEEVIFGLGFQSTDLSGTWINRHDFIIGEEIDRPDGRFVRYNLILTRLQALGDDALLILRGSAQLSDQDLLPPSEQFQIGGMTTVRGYPEGLLIGDDGYFVSAELNFPLGGEGARLGRLSIRDAFQGVVFFDNGGAFAYEGSNASRDHDDILTSFGFGINCNFNKLLTGRLALGIPLSNIDADTDDYRIHFYLQSSPF